MITFILGFLCWPLIGFIYISIYNLYNTWNRSDSISTWGWQNLFLGPVLIIVDIHDRFFIKNKITKNL